MEDANDSKHAGAQNGDAAPAWERLWERIGAYTSSGRPSVSRTKRKGAVVRCSSREK